MVNDSMKAWRVRKHKKHVMMLPASSTLMNKQREYDARTMEYIRHHSAPVPRSTC